MSQEDAETDLEARVREHEAAAEDARARLYAVRRQKCVAAVKTAQARLEALEQDEALRTRNVPEVTGRAELVARACDRRNWAPVADGKECLGGTKCWYRAFCDKDPAGKPGFEFRYRETGTVRACDACMKADVFDDLVKAWATETGRGFHSESETSSNQGKATSRTSSDASGSTGSPSRNSSGVVLNSANNA